MLSRASTTSDSPASAGKPPDYDIFAEYYQDVTRYAASRARLGDEVKDVVQEAYLRVFKLNNPEQIRTPKLFLFRTVRNLILDRVRKQQVRARYAADADDSARIEAIADTSPTPAAAVNQRERKTMLEAAVAALPERTREIFILNAYAKMSYAEIADHMGISKSAVAKYLTRAIAAVTTNLAERDPV